MFSLLKKNDSIQTNQISSAEDIKLTKLRQFANAVLEDPMHKQHFISLMNSFQLNINDIINAYIEYNYDIYSFGNEIYNSIANRFVLHIHNLLKGSWHIERQKTITKMIKNIQPNSLIDIGFGVPSQYIKELALIKRKPKVILCDLYDTAFQFGSAILTLWDKDWQEVVSFKQADMQDVNTIGDYDTYLFQDSIEHVPEPTDCLKNYVKVTPQHATFILSLPIGPLIPAHFIEWQNDNEALIWLEFCGLTVKEHKIIWVNPAVDLFAEPLGSDHHNLVVLCNKTS